MMQGRPSPLPRSLAAPLDRQSQPGKLLKDTAELGTQTMPVLGEGRAQGPPHLSAEQSWTPAMKHRF